MSVSSRTVSSRELTRRWSRRLGQLTRPAVTAALLLGAACQHEQTSGGAKASAFHVTKDQVSVSHRGPVAFDVTDVKQGPSLPLPGVTARITTVEALTSPSFAPLAGRVIESQVHLGDQVKKGQQLVLVRTADLPTLERDVRSAELAITTRSASVERMRALVESRAGSANDLLLAESELAESKLGLQAARSRLSSLQISRGTDDTAYWVVASRNGTVVQLEATPGSLVGPERGAPVVTIADLAEVLAVADVPQGDAVELNKGMTARIFPFGKAGESIIGQVEVVSDVVDPERQTVPVRVRVDNAAHKLRPNAYVDLSFDVSDHRTATLVPAVSVVRDGASAVVFVETDKGTFVKRPIVVGRRTRDEVEVISGVARGERVVTTGALLLVNALDVGA
ncbi:MAG: czcB [Myxococcaceae bacterium]|nr:czcB [Myxococcaceae bacterium]